MVSYRAADGEARSKEAHRLIELEEVVERPSTNSSEVPLTLIGMPSNDISMVVAVPTVMSQTKHKLLVSCFIVFTIAQGYMASVMPWGAGWRYFSWHPFLMTTGFVGMMGSAVVTKKLGGYTNTKLHGLLASTGTLMVAVGLYVIFDNKRNFDKPHLTSNHSVVGIIAIAGCFTVMLIGGVFLHPDFGFDNQNKAIRLCHKWFSRMVIILAWIACYMGLMQLTSTPIILIIYGIPLLMLMPATLI